MNHSKPTIKDNHSLSKRSIKCRNNRQSVFKTLMYDLSYIILVAKHFRQHKLNIQKSRQSNQLFASTHSVAPPSRVMVLLELALAH